MRDPGEFDDFYAAARQRLLLQAFALTGDVGAAKAAVRDAFIAGWHHWHKVARQDDPEAWVRPLAWQHAQRRHTAHFWHRDRSLAPEHRATLDALDELGSIQRRALILHVLAGLPSDAFRHEIGQPRESASRQLKLALAQFAIHRDIDPEDVAPTLHALAGPLDTVRLPRASIIRRAGTARRRVHTSGAVAATVALALGVGFAVSHDATTTVSLAGARGDAAVGGTTTSVVLLDSAALLGSDVLDPLAPGQGLAVTATGDNSAGTGLNLPCQPRRYADPKAIGALVRSFATSTGPATGFVQVAERSASEAAASAAYTETLSWFSDCAGTRIELLAAQGLQGAGDEGYLLVLRDWADPITTWTIGVVRTGSIVTTLARHVATPADVDPAPFVPAVGTAVAGFCASDGGGTCPTTPTLTPAPPPPGPTSRGLLQTVDLTEIASAPHPWVGTAAKTPTVNAAATTCDAAQFQGPDITWATSRTFLKPDAGLPTRFGLTETLGRFTGEAQAQAFVAEIEKRMNTCEDRDLSASVEELTHQPLAGGEVHVWRFTAEVSDDESITFWMAVLRQGAVAAQVGFVPVEQATIDQRIFQVIVDRAVARLANLPPA